MRYLQGPRRRLLVFSDDARACASSYAVGREGAAVSSTAQSLAEEIRNKPREEDWVIYQCSPVHLRRVLNQWYFKASMLRVPAQTLR